MANDRSVDWQFSGSEAAKAASAASLAKLFALCDPLGKPILAPRRESPETSHTAEKPVAPSKRAVLEYLSPEDFFDMGTRRTLNNIPSPEESTSFLRDRVDFGYSKLKHIPSLTCSIKPEASTFLWTELDVSCFVDIEDDQDFCNKLAKEENLVVLPGVAFGQKNWLRHSIDMETQTLEDAFKRLKSFCDRHSK